MKKFLAILLIAIAVCKTEPAVEEEAFDFKDLFQKAVELLKSTGLWEKAMNLLQSFFSTSPAVDENGEVQLKALPAIVVMIIGNLIVEVVTQIVMIGGKKVVREIRRRVIGHK